MEKVKYIASDYKLYYYPDLSIISYDTYSAGLQFLMSEEKDNYDDNNFYLIP